MLQYDPPYFRAQQMLGRVCVRGRTRRLRTEVFVAGCVSTSGNAEIPREMEAPTNSHGPILSASLRSPRERIGEFVH